MINKIVSCTEKCIKDIPLHNYIPYSNMALLLRAHDESLLDHLHLAKRSTISV